MTLKQLASAVCLSLALCNAQATPSMPYTFNEPRRAEQFQQLIKQLRCVSCQNQTLADSDMPIARHMRAEVYRRLQEGQSPEHIIAHLQQRYGEFVNYSPPMDARTGVLWLGPWLFVGIALLTLWRRLRYAR